MSTEIAERSPTQQLLERISSADFKAELELAMPPGVSVDRFVRVTKTAILQNPELVTCDRASLFTAIARCAQDGLLPDGRKAAFVIFRAKGGLKKAQYLAMIGGLRDIASDRGFSLEAYVVYANDLFEWELGFDPTVTHKPPALNAPRGEALGAYSVATQLDTGQKFLEVMSLDEIEQVRSVSRAKDDGPWVQWWGEMARKTVARRLFKQLPLGELDEREQEIVKNVDADVDLPTSNGTLTAEEADIAAGLVNLAPPLDPGPDDSSAAKAYSADDDGSAVVPSPVAAAEPVVEDGEWTEATDESDVGETVIPGGVHKGKTLRELASTDQGEQWLLTQLRRLDVADPMRDPIARFVAGELPDVWERYTS